MGKALGFIVCLIVFHFTRALYTHTVAMSIHDDWPGTITYPYSCDTLCQCWSSWWETWHLTWSYINGCCWTGQVSSGLGEWVWSTVKKQGTLSHSLMGLAWITVVHIEPRKFGHKTLQNQEAGQESKRKIKGNVRPEREAQPEWKFPFLSSTENTLRGK